MSELNSEAPALAAIAPIVGTARVASPTGNIVETLDVAIDVEDVVAQSEE